MNNKEKEKKIKSFEFITAKNIEIEDEWKKKTISTSKCLLDLKNVFNLHFFTCLHNFVFSLMLTVK